MENTTQYTYNPLTTANSIRTITLLPGSGIERLRCTLTEIDLDENSPYEAISYVWGEETNPASLSVICDGIEKTHKITQNLAAALFRFRKEGEARVLWADAICINQDDLVERGHQVRLMGRVYQEASCVLIWLGEEDEHTEFVSTCITAPETVFRGVNIGSELPGKVALKLFFDRPWFHRAWTFQESILAKHAEVHCGSHQFHKKDVHNVMTAVTILSQNLSGEIPEFQHLQTLKKTM